MSIAEHIIRVAQAASAHQGIALSTYGRRELGHGHFFTRLSAGRVTIRRAEAAMQHISDHWPSDLEWPCDIERPAPQKAAPQKAAPQKAAPQKAAPGESALSNPSPGKDAA